MEMRTPHSLMPTRYILVRSQTLKVLEISYLLLFFIGMSETWRTAEFVMERSETVASLFASGGSKRRGRFRWYIIVSQTPLHRPEFGQRLVIIDCTQKANGNGTKNCRPSSQSDDTFRWMPNLLALSCDPATSLIPKDRYASIFKCIKLWINLINFVFRMFGMLGFMGFKAIQLSSDIHLLDAIVAVLNEQLNSIRRSWCSNLITECHGQVAASLAEPKRLNSLWPIPEQEGNVFLFRWNDRKLTSFSSPSSVQVVDFLWTDGFSWCRRLAVSSVASSEPLE